MLHHDDRGAVLARSKERVWLIPDPDRLAREHIPVAIAVTVTIAVAVATGRPRAIALRAPTPARKG